MITSTRNTANLSATAASQPTTDSTQFDQPHVAIELSLIVPCFNEADGAVHLRSRLMNWLEQRPGTAEWELIVVDDGSTDATIEAFNAQFADQTNFRLVRHAENRGLTAALASGFAAARGRWIVCLDADCTYDPVMIDQLLAKAETGFDVVTASPYHPEGRVENVASWRIVLSKIASLMYGCLLSTRLSCYTCCVRIYDADLLKRCPPIRSSGFVGVTEILWQLDRTGARIGEVPAALRPRQTGVSKMRTFRTTLRHLRLLGRIARCRVTGYYNSLNS